MDINKSNSEVVSQFVEDIIKNCVSKIENKLQNIKVKTSVVKKNKSESILKKDEVEELINIFRSKSENDLKKLKIDKANFKNFVNKGVNKSLNKSVNKNEIKNDDKKSDIECVLHLDSKDKESYKKNSEIWHDLSRYKNNCFSSSRMSLYNGEHEAMYFNGKTCFQMKAVLPKNCQKFTFECYFRPQYNHINQVLIDQRTKDLNIEKRCRRGCMFIRKDRGGFNGANNDRDNILNFDCCEWNHWVLVMDVADNYIRMYRDGIYVTLKKFPRPFELNLIDGDLSIGGPVLPTENAWFVGFIKTIRIYRGCLTDEMIKQNYKEIIYTHNNKVSMAHLNGMNTCLPYNKEDVTIILEGKIRFGEHIDLRNTIRKYKNLCKQIIVTSYMETDYERQLKEICPNIKIIKNDMNELTQKTDKKYGRISASIRKRGFEQFFHMASTLPLVETSYVVKTRVDQEFSNFAYFVYQTILNGRKEKVTLFPYYIRGALCCKYHPSDMLFGSTTEILKQIWLPEDYTPYRQFEHLIEPAIYKGYMDRKSKEMNVGKIKGMSNEEYGKFMSKLFTVVNAKKLEPYCMHGVINCFGNARNYKQYDESCEDNTYEFFSSAGCEPAFRLF